MRGIHYNTKEYHLFTSPYGPNTGPFPHTQPATVNYNAGAVLSPTLVAGLNSIALPAGSYSTPLIMVENTGCQDIWCQASQNAGPLTSLADGLQVRGNYQDVMNNAGGSQIFAAYLNIYALTPGTVNIVRGF